MVSLTCFNTFLIFTTELLLFIIFLLYFCFQSAYATEFSNYVEKEEFFYEYTRKRSAEYAIGFNTNFS